MAYSRREFPGSTLFDSDLTELIEFYQKLKVEYNDFVARLVSLESRMFELENHIDEVLDKKIKTVYEQMEAINKRMDEINSNMTVLRQYIDEQMLLIRNEFNEQNKHVAEQLAENERKINTVITELENNVAEQLEVIQNNTQKQLTALENWTRTYVTGELKKFDDTLIELDNDIINLKNYVDTTNYKLKTELEKEIKELEKKIVDITVDQVWVVNPVDGVIGNIQHVIDDMWAHTTWWQLTAQEYANIGLTAEEYAYFPLYIKGRYGLTAEEYAYLGKWYLLEKGGLILETERLNKKWIEHCNNVQKEIYKKFETFKKDVKNQITMTSPFTGQTESVVDVLYEILPLLMSNCLTAQEYADLELTAQEYADKDITAYEYAWKSLLIFSGNRYNGLTAEQYSRLGVNELGQIVLA